MSDKDVNPILGAEPPTADGVPPEPPHEGASTTRLVATLAVAGTLAGLLIVLVNLHTRPIIEKYQAEQLQKAVYEVLPGAERYDTYYLVDGNLTLTLPKGAKEKDYKRLYIGHGSDGEVKGIAISKGESGFQDVILLIFGFDPETGKMTGMKVLDSKETPGLGDKIYKDKAFVKQFFEGPKLPLVGVKAGTGKGLPNEVDTITGATISSRAVIRIINDAMADWKPVLERGIPRGAKDAAAKESKP
jgi:electron transport complex protein RnfG